MCNSRSRATLAAEQLSQKDVQLSQKDVQLSQQKEQLSQKDAQLSRQETQLRASIKMLLDAGLSPAKVAENLGIDLTDISTV